MACHMPEIYERDLDLNLLRVFAVVAEAGSVTEAARRLYLTQPAVSAALRRLNTTVGRRCSCAADGGWC
jgi:LysR family transcriptional activator of mexEF-oprN operon